MTIDWHARFIQQALWTKSIRDYLLQDVVLDGDTPVLEVGCGTGVIAEAFHQKLPCRLFGVDLDFQRCLLSTRYSSNFSCQNSDAYRLPYAPNSFQMVFCHYFLLWIHSPEIVLQEILRVLQPGGQFIAFAEPDYSARIDTPASLKKLGDLQTLSLQTQGASIQIGRQLAALSSDAHFTHNKFGISGYEQNAGTLPDWWESEWEVIQNDLYSFVTNDQLMELKRIDKESWLNGSRVLWVPTFYLSCLKPMELTIN